MNHYGILAFPVGHSRSPALQQAAFDHLDIPAQYHRYEIAPDDLASFIQRIRDDHISGLSVSIPHKESIMPLLDEVDEVAIKIGAVNTVFWRDDQLCGTNTDYIGIGQALAGAGISLSGKRVVVLGAGGAARAVAYVCQQIGVYTTVLARRLDQAKALATDFDLAAGTLAELAQYPADVLIHTSPVGMAGEWAGQSLVSPAYLAQHRPSVFDLIYNPAETQLLADARAAGCVCLNGMSMFLHQGAAQFKIWTGHTAPLDVMQAVLEG